MITKIKYELSNSKGWSRNYSNEIDTYGYHSQLVQAFEDAIELFELRQEAYRKKYGLPEASKEEAK